MHGESDLGYQFDKEDQVNAEIFVELVWWLQSKIFLV